MTTPEYTEQPWIADGREVIVGEGTCAAGAVIADCNSAATATLMAACREMLAALKGAIGALEFSRDYHTDLGNADQAFAQDRLDAALVAIAKAEGAA